MTDEQVEEVRKLDRAPDGSCWYCKTVMSGHFPGCPVAALPRLLEERKRLLAAVRPFTEGANSIMFRKAMLEAGLESHVKEVQAAADAVAFAEEPAR